MGLLTSRRTTRAQRKAHAKALKAKAKMEARLESRGARREMRATRRHEKKLSAQQIRAQRKSDATAAKTASATNKANIEVAKLERERAMHGTRLTPKKIKRYTSLARVAAPVAVPLAYRGATLIREQLTTLQANRAGVPVDELHAYSGHGAALSARINGAQKSLASLANVRDNDAETKKFVSTMQGRLTDLTAAVSAAEHMPAARRRRAHQAISTELTAIDADIMARLGVRP